MTTRWEVGQQVVCIDVHEGYNKMFWKHHGHLLQANAVYTIKQIVFHVRLLAKVIRFNRQLADRILKENHND